MCTLSWQQYADRLDILFNRDERYSRPPAVPPAIASVNGIRVLAPQDPEGGGTWLASNERGLTLCLLNDYRCKSRAAFGQAGPWRSRGLLVRELAGLQTFAAVRNKLRKSVLTDYQPFILVVFAGIQPQAQWLWNGTELYELERPASPVSTSSLFPRMIPWLRQRLFHRATQSGRKALTAEKHMALHTGRRPWPPAFAIAMSRRDKGTVSLTRICITAGAVDMTYWQGDPAGKPEQVIYQSLQIGQGPLELPAKAQQPSRGSVADA
jgi:hypothetical protein